MCAEIDHNKELARRFGELGDLLEVAGENRFKVNAYRDAQRLLSTLQVDIQQVAAAGELRSLPGVGAAIASKIEEYFRTGKIKRHEEILQQFPPSLVEVLRLPGMGPKRAQAVFRELSVGSLAELEVAAREGRLRSVEGFGATTEAAVLRALKRVGERDDRILLGRALPLAEAIVADLMNTPGLVQVVAAGSLRRFRETVGDVDLVAATSSPEALLDRFVHLGLIREAVERGDATVRAYSRDSHPIELRAVPPERFGAALLAATGSKAHLARLQRLAAERTLELHADGLHDGNGQVVSATETEIYGHLGLPFIAPELREDEGEIEAALAGTLPRLVERGDIRGDLHAHTNWSDGGGTIEEMAQAARALGYEYLAITDHSRSRAVAGGMSVELVRQQRTVIDALNRDLAPFRLLAGIEVDIKSDGKLDFDDALMRTFDYVVASVHSSFSQEEAKMTARLVAACEHPFVDVLGHLTGRLINKRPGYELDIATVLEAAARTGTAIEINSMPDRLDLRDEVARAAKAWGVTIAINSDSHAPSHFEVLRFGLGTARRAWLTPDDVLNTLALDQLLEWLSRRRARAGR